jgi:hypothetical protein
MKGGDRGVQDNGEVYRLVIQDNGELDFMLNNGRVYNFNLYTGQGRKGG